MKKFLFCVLMVLGLATSLQADPVALSYENNTSTTPGGNKTPVRPWCVDLTDNIITMAATPCDYTLNLYDEDEDVVYSVFVPAGTTQVILPTTLSGDFELRFETDTYYYYGFIYL